MSYNHKKAQVMSREKELRDHSIDPTANDNQTITDKNLPHRQGVKDTITEDQFSSVMKEQSTDIPIIEKVLNEAKSYVLHRSDAGDISVPPINALVEKNIQDREDWEVDKKPHWSITFDDKKQQGALPRLSKNAPQHDKIVLNNDPRRFEGKNNSLKGEKPSIKPLVGNITQADISGVAEKIKTGSSVEYDSAIVAILRDAERETRELTNVERKTISDLKTARTNAMLKLVK